MNLSENIIGGNFKVMNYIILDLEWNQCPHGKGEEKLPFEIIEIGAVKLDENRQNIGSFHRFIAPSVYHELHRVTGDIINVTMEELNKGEPFEKAAKEFLEWCGEEEYIFGTWGSMDLTELQRNCQYFHVEHDFGMPLFYYDIQKLYSICNDDGKSRLALEAAIEKEEIVKDHPFHSAEADAIYTAELFQKLDFEKVKIYTSIDTFRVPLNRQEEFTVNYGTYSKYISHAYKDRDEMMTDVEILSTRCYVCRKNAKKRIRWYSNNQKMYYCLSECQTHGYLKGKIRIKKNDNNEFFAIKILKLTNEDGAKLIKQRQIAEREKRREKRHRDKAGK